MGAFARRLVLGHFDYCKIPDLRMRYVSFIKNSRTVSGKDQIAKNVSRLLRLIPTFSEHEACSLAASFRNGLRVII